MKYVIIILVFFINLKSVAQSLVKYQLVICDTTLVIQGENKKVIAVNGQLPAPTLHFTIGDTAEITVINKMHHETSIHWHGLILPNNQDGVPYLTTAPIKPHNTFVYKFPIVQTGTYWYHSHTMLQEQIGMYGALIIYPKNYNAINDQIMLLSDWSNENPIEIERSLHQATDWYGIRKNATQSYVEAMRENQGKTKTENEWKRMMAMDVSDVYYNHVFINGATIQKNENFSAGDTVRVRIINGSASTYFWINYAGGKMYVIASDGMDVEPVPVDRLIIGVSEIYDIEIIIPENKQFELRATTEDRTQFASLFLGKGESVGNASMPRLQYFEGMKMMNDMMTISGNMNDMGMAMSLQQMDMNAVMYPELQEKEIITLNYNMLRSPVPTSLPEKPFRNINLTLTGNMNRYVWTIDNQTISESDIIQIKKGENIRLIITNNSMMRHPMHLHGHFFRVVNQHQAYSPLKNVIDIMPMETDTLEFHASEDKGNWYFHCHILYHMMSGMGRILTYENEVGTINHDHVVNLKKVYHDDRRFYNGAEIALQYNGSIGEISRSNTRWLFQTEWRVNYTGDYENEFHLGRYIGKKQFATVYTGWDIRKNEESENTETWFGQTNTATKRSVFCIGLQYILPWFIVTDIRLDQDGYTRVQIRRDDIPVSKKIRMWGMVNSDKEFNVGARYILGKFTSIGGSYDSDLGAGVGLYITY